MNNILGQVVKGKVTDENDKSYFVQVDGITFMLDKSEIKKPLHLGGEFQGFAYENENHDLQITRDVPNVQIDHYDWGTVVNSKFGLGVFVDIGLPNKDIAVSIDDLPKMTSLWPQRGDRLMISLKVDKKGRIWGELADEDIFKAISVPAQKRMMNYDMKATVYQPKLAGSKVITDDYYLGFIHQNERDQEPRLGQHVSVRVIGVHPDNTLNLSMRLRGYEAISPDAKMILEVLRHSNDGHIPYNDKSDPASIKTYFGISKGQFKRAVGHLLKQRLVTTNEKGLFLVSNDDQNQA